MSLLRMVSKRVGRPNQHPTTASGRIANRFVPTEDPLAVMAQSSSRTVTGCPQFPEVSFPRCQFRSLGEQSDRSYELTSHNVANQEIVALHREVIAPTGR